MLPAKYYATSRCAAILSFQVIMMLTISAAPRRVHSPANTQSRKGGTQGSLPLVFKVKQVTIKGSVHIHAKYSANNPAGGCAPDADFVLSQVLCGAKPPAPSRLVGEARWTRPRMQTFVRPSASFPTKSGNSIDYRTTGVPSTTSV